MTDPIDLELARLRSHADQLRSTVRDALLEMDRGDFIELFRTCARGDLSGLDHRVTALVAWLALVAVFAIFERDDELT